MRPRGAAAVSLGLWVLVTVSVVADPGGAEPRRCLLSHYRWLDPRALAAVKALRDHYVSDAQTPILRGRCACQGSGTLVPVPRGPGILASSRRLSDLREADTLDWRPRNCSLRPKRDPPRPSVRPAGRRGEAGAGGAAVSNSTTCPQSCARLRLVARGLSEAQAVLSSLPSPELLPGVAPTLQLLAAARKDVVACVSVPRARPLYRPQGCSALSGPTARPPIRDSPVKPLTGRDTIGVLRRQMRALVRGREARGRGWWETRSFAPFVYLPSGLQLQLVRPGPWRKPQRPPRRRPRRQRANSPRCHEASVIFSLLRLLTWDLKLVAHSGPCL
ncbi:LOW QUALITY PROTEIN: interferon lambda-4-like [Molossus nigricans]